MWRYLLYKVRLNWIKVTSDNLAYTVAYVYQKLLDSVKAFERYKQKCALASVFLGHTADVALIQYKVFVEKA